MEVLIAVCIGIVATIVMTGLLVGITRSGLAEADMVRAIGSLLLRREAGALKVGMVAHLAVGVICALVYVAVWSLFDFSGFAEFAMVGAMVGFGHGLVVSLILVIVVAENHPLERFRTAGVGVALSHLVAHVVFGVVVGLGVAASDVRFEGVHQIAEKVIPSQRTY